MKPLIDYVKIRKVSNGSMAFWVLCSKNHKIVSMSEILAPTSVILKSAARIAKQLNVPIKK